MLVLTTLQNICQLLIHVWRQASNQGPSDLCKLYSQSSTNRAIAGLTPTIESPQHTLNMLPDAQIYWHLPRAKSHTSVSSLRGHGNLLSHFCACHPCGAMEILQGASNSHG